MMKANLTNTDMNAIANQNDGEEHEGGNFQILIVEDNAADLMIMREALEETGFSVEVHETRNGEDAMKFLRRAGDCASAPRPDLILLDLNMPRKNGHEVLEEIKMDRMLMRIPVIVLTTSEAEEDVSRAYAEHANCYIRKPVDFDAFCDVMRQIRTFWLETVRLPGTIRSGCHAV